MNKVFQGLYCDAFEALTYYSQAVSMGHANSAMIEGVLVSSTLTNAAVLTLEGSNDGQVWTVIKDTAITPVDVNISLGPTAPAYDQSSDQRCIIGFALVRIRVVLTEGTPTGKKCVLDASIRTFQTA